MIGKFSEVLNEIAGLANTIAIVIDNPNDSRKQIIIMDREAVRPIKKDKIIIFDSKMNFTPAFKNYAQEQFGGIIKFLKNSMFVNSLDDAKMRLKKEKKYLEIGNEE
jgi:hypothetical protein